MINKLKKYLRHGAGEVLAFMTVLPALIIVFATVIGLVQVGLVKERLEYTAYQACRAAIVCKDLNEAQKVAQKTAEDDLKKAKGKGGMKYVDGSVKVELEIVSDGAVTNTGKSTKSKSKSKKEDELWVKGNYVQCKLEVDLKPLTVFMRGKRYAVITMMIEYPMSADDGEGYPWFRHMK